MKSRADGGIGDHHVDTQRSISRLPSCQWSTIGKCNSPRIRSGLLGDRSLWPTIATLTLGQDPKYLKLQAPLDNPVIVAARCMEILLYLPSKGAAIKDNQTGIYPKESDSSAAGLQLNVLTHVCREVCN